MKTFMENEEERSAVSSWLLVNVDVERFFILEKMSESQVESF